MAGHLLVAQLPTGQGTLLLAKLPDDLDVRSIFRGFPRHPFSVNLARQEVTDLDTRAHLRNRCQAGFGELQVLPGPSLEWTEADVLRLFKPGLNPSDCHTVYVVGVVDAPWNSSQANRLLYEYILDRQ